MEFKQLKKELLKSDHADWFKTVEIEFHSNPCDFHRKFVGIESFHQFLEKELAAWNNLNSVDLPEPLKESSRQMISLYEELNFNLERLNELIVSPDNFINKLGSLITNFRNNNYLPSSPECLFLINLNKLNFQSVKGAHGYLCKKLNSSYWTNDQHAVFGVLAAYEFSSGEQSHLFNRRAAEKKTFAQLRKHFEEEIEDINQIKHSRSIELDQRIQNFEQLISEIRSQQNEEQIRIYTDATRKIEELEHLYTDKLMLEKPVEYWDKRAIDLKQSANKWLLFAFGSSILGLVLFAVLAASLSTDYITKHIKNPAVSIRWSILSILAIALIVFLVRTFTKLTMSSYHLYRDAQERKHLTYLYLSLKSETEIPDADRHIILQSLFSRSDTGLLKEDSGPTMPSAIWDRIQK